MTSNRPWILIAFFMSTSFIFASFMFAGGSPRADGVSLHDLAATLQIDQSAVSVSGVSSGAYMAQQFHVVHSSRIMGAGLVAGGPYNCAGGSSFLSMFDPTNVYTALHVCSATNLLGLFLGPPDVEQSIVATLEEADGGTIDDPSHLARARVWLFSGANDAKIPRPVVESSESYYRAFLDPEKIRFVKHPRANHAMITENFGNSCESVGRPFVNDCDFGAAEALLQHIHGPQPLAPKVSLAEVRSAAAFDQTEFFDESDESVSLHDLGHVYVPKRCAAGERCRLHVAFHGCLQHQDEIGDAFYHGAGYNAVAEANGIVVLYPQTKAWTGSFLFGAVKNPMACWDWWGYSGEDFLRRTGKQVRAVARMINVLVGEDILQLE